MEKMEDYAERLVRPVIDLEEVNEGDVPIMWRVLQQLLRLFVTLTIGLKVRVFPHCCSCKRGADGYCASIHNFVDYELNFVIKPHVGNMEGLSTLPHRIRLKIHTALNELGRYTYRRVLVGILAEVEEGLQVSFRHALWRDLLASIKGWTHFRHTSDAATEEFEAILITIRIAFFPSDMTYCHQLTSHFLDKEGRVILYDGSNRLALQNYHMGPIWAGRGHCLGFNGWFVTPTPGFGPGRGGGMITTSGELIARFPKIQNWINGSVLHNGKLGEVVRLLDDSKELISDERGCLSFHYKSG